MKSTNDCKCTIASVYEKRFSRLVLIQGSGELASEKQSFLSDINTALADEQERIGPQSAWAFHGLLKSNYREGGIVGQSEAETRATHSQSHRMCKHRVSNNSMSSTLRAERAGELVDTTRNGSC